MRTKGKQVQLGEYLQNSLETYFDISMEQVSFFVDEQLRMDDIIAYFDGQNIRLNQRFFLLEPLAQIKVIAHEIAHLCQSMDSFDQEAGVCIQELQMEVNAHMEALSFQYEFVRGSICKHAWNRRQSRKMRTAKNRIQAYGLGGIFTIKQVLLDRLSKKDGIAVDYEGVHEFLTRQAILTVEDKISKMGTTGMPSLAAELKKVSNRNSLILGSEVNDLYFFQDVYIRILEKLLSPEDIKALQKNLQISLEDMNQKMHQLKSTNNIFESVKILSSKVYTDNYSSAVMRALAEIFHQYINITLASLEIQEYTSEIRELFQKNFVDRYRDEIDTIKKISKSLYGLVREGTIALDEFLLEHTPIGLIKEGLLEGIDKFFDWWEDPESAIFVEVEEAFLSLLETLPRNFKICESLYENIKQVYCIGQFLMYSHSKDLQFLHSMDCSKGDTSLNIDKCTRWARFCITVFLNEKYKNKPILDWNLRDYIVSIYREDKEDLLPHMLMPLLLNITSAMNCTEKANKKAKTQNAKERQRVWMQTEIMEGVLRDRAEAASFFAKGTVGAFFNLCEKDNPRFVALGMAMHMMEDSFTGSHLIRTWNIHSGKEVIIPEDENYEQIKDQISPVLYFADYTKQDATRHAHADCFVDLFGGVDDDMSCELCSRESDGMCMDIEMDDKMSKPRTTMDDLELEKLHNCHRTVGAESARRYTAHFLYLVVTIPRYGVERKHRMDQIERYLRSIYLDANELPYIKEKNIVSLSNNTCVPVEECSDRVNQEYLMNTISFAGRSFEKEELQQLNLRERFKEFIIDLSITERLDTILGKKFPGDLQELFDIIKKYREYLLENFGRSIIPTKEYIVKKCKEEDKQVIARELEGSSLAKRILIMYRLFDLPMLSNILLLIEKLKKKKEEAMLKLERQYERKTLLSLYEQIEFMYTRYQGHIYELYMNVQWMGEQSRLQETHGKTDYDAILQEIDSTLLSYIVKWN